MNTIVLFIGAGIFVTLGDLALAYWARTSNSFLLFFGLLLNLIGVIFYANTLGLESIGKATSFFLAINIVAVTLAGAMLFQENINFSQIFGIIGVVISIILMEI